MVGVKAKTYVQFYSSKFTGADVSCEAACWLHISA